MGSVKSVSIEQWLRYWKEQSKNLMAVDTAYKYVPWFRTSVNRIANAAQGIPFAIYRGDKRVAQEDDYKALKIFPVELHLMTLINSVAGDLQMYGRSHYQYQVGMLGDPKVERVGAKYISYWEDAKKNITHVEYNRGSHREVHPIGAGLMDEDDYGYGMPHVWLMNRVGDGSPDDPPAVAALKAAGMLDSMAEFGRNAMDAGGAGPTLVKIEGYSSADQAEKERTKNWFERMWQATNAFKPLVISKGIEVQRLGWSPEEISFPDLSREKREDVLAAFDIPMSVGMGNAANYATAQVDRENFYNFKIMPLWGTIADQINPQLKEAFGVEIRAEKHRLDVYQEAEARKSRNYLPWVDRGVIGVNEARSYMSMPPRETVTDDIFLSPASQAEALPSGATNETVDTTIKPDSGGSVNDLTKALTDGNTVEGMIAGLGAKALNALAGFVSVPLGNEGAILEFVRELRRMYPVLLDERIEWQLAPTWHITLAYAEMVTDAVYLAAANDVVVERLRLAVDRMGVFENGAERALHLRVADDAGLSRVQRSVWSALNARGVVMSEYSNPNQYQPHVTIAYLPPGLDVSGVLAAYNPEGDVASWWLAFEAEKVCFSRDNYEPVVTLEAPEYGTVADEFNAAIRLWERKAVRRFEEGKPEKALEFEDEALSWGVRNAIMGGLEGAKTVEDVRGVFELAGAGGWEVYP